MCCRVIVDMSVTHAPCGNKLCFQILHNTSQGAQLSSVDNHCFIRPGLDRALMRSRLGPLLYRDSLAGLGAPVSGSQTGKYFSVSKIRLPRFGGSAVSVKGRV